MLLFCLRNNTCKCNLLANCLRNHTKRCIIYIQPSRMCLHGWCGQSKEMLAVLCPNIGLAFSHSNLCHVNTYCAHAHRHGTYLSAVLIALTCDYFVRVFSHFAGGLRLVSKLCKSWGLVKVTILDFHQIMKVFIAVVLQRISLIINL